MSSSYLGDDARLARVRAKYSIAVHASHLVAPGANPINKFEPKLLLYAGIDPLEKLYLVTWLM